MAVCWSSDFVGRLVLHARRPQPSAVTSNTPSSEASPFKRFPEAPIARSRDVFRRSSSQRLAPPYSTSSPWPSTPSLLPVAGRQIAGMFTSDDPPWPVVLTMRSPCCVRRSIGRRQTRSSLTALQPTNDLDSSPGSNFLAIHSARLRTRRSADGEGRNLNSSCDTLRIAKNFRSSN